MSTGRTILRVATVAAVLVLAYYIGQPVWWELEARLQEYREGADIINAGTL